MNIYLVRTDTAAGKTHILQDGKLVATCNSAFNDIITKKQPQMSINGETPVELFSRKNFIAAGKVRFTRQGELYIGRKEILYGYHRANELPEEYDTLLAQGATHAYALAITSPVKNVVVCQQGENLCGMVLAEKNKHTIPQALVMTLARRIQDADYIQHFFSE